MVPPGHRAVGDMTPVYLRPSTGIQPSGFRIPGGGQLTSFGLDHDLLRTCSSEP